MDSKDVILAVLYLNWEKGRKLNEIGLKEIVESLGVEMDPQAVRDMIAIGWMTEDYDLTEEGKLMAQRALKRLEKEIKRGPFGAIKWFNFKLKAVPDNINPNWLVPKS